ncbi:hypothetical protein E8E12_006517 [Didymella heteroderae]|uniref:Uncharacterized protein n=1 Tax=Didymella heteroderae TaxID=1769908 RepID=A0A9P4WX51_9PLEO|nr:hypothetical protein E8E12_006517 [Didymella heteroderae]
MTSQDWGEEFERYDICDYIAVLVSGMLSRAHRLDTLHVRLNNLDAQPTTEDALAATSVLIQSFRRLRCVRRPRLMGVYQDARLANMYCRHDSLHNHCQSNCIRPPSLEPVPVLVPGMSAFDDIAAPWEQTLAQRAPTNLTPISSLTKLFVEFKEFHNKVAVAMPHIARPGRQCFLHQARVARECGDIGWFRAVAAQLMASWRHHVQLQNAQRHEVNVALERMMDADTYPGGRGARPRVRD